MDLLRAGRHCLTIITVCVDGMRLLETVAIITTAIDTIVMVALVASWV